MPKQSKNIRQNRDNSNLFKEAKRRFHYEPKQLIYPYFLQSKAKKQERNQRFKQDYSSVKDLKNQNNEINESSWIAKLVNGIQQQFADDTHLKKQLADAKIIESNNYFSEPMDISPDNVVIAAEKNIKHLPVTRNTSILNSSNPTKKNSFNCYKKNEEKKMVKNVDKRLNRDGSSDTIAIKNTSHSKCKKQSKPNVIVNPKISPRMKSKSQASIKAEMRTKVKSIENVKSKKSSVNQCQSSFNEGHIKCSTRKTVEQPRKSNTSITRVNFIKKPNHINEQPIQIQEITCVTNKKGKDFNYQSIRQKIDVILDNDKTDPLFQNQIKRQLNLKQQAKPSAKSINYGSIKKNHINKTQQNPPISKRSFSSIDNQSYKKDSSTFCHKSIFYAQGAISERPIEENDMITPRQEKALIDKYLRSDYSFKSHKLNSNDGRQIVKSPYKRDGKKYSYKIDGITEQEVNALAQIPTLREKGYFTQNREVSERVTSSFGHQIFQNHNSNKLPLKYQNISLRNQIQNQRANKQNITTLSTRKNSINPRNAANSLYAKVSPKTIRERQEKLMHLNKDAYLQESNQTSALQSLLSSNQHKVTPRSAIKQQNSIIPSKYSYLCANSTFQESVKISKQKPKQQTTHSSPISQISIDRLTSKLNSYITQHQLHKQLNPSNQHSRGQQSNHRMLKLNFNELKKHNDFNTNERHDLFLF